MRVKFYLPSCTLCGPVPLTLQMVPGVDENFYTTKQNSHPLHADDQHFKDRHVSMLFDEHLRDIIYIFLLLLIIVEKLALAYAMSANIKITYRLKKITNIQ